MRYGAVVIVIEHMETWPSGLRHSLAKREALVVRPFESDRLRRVMNVTWRSSRSRSSR